MSLRRRALALALLPLLALLPQAAAANDAGTGEDAGDTFEDATAVAAAGRHHGALATGDLDWYRFPVAAGASIDIDVTIGLIVGFLQVSDVDRRVGVRLYDPHGVVLDTPVSNVGDARVTWPRALVAGDYRLALDAAFLGTRSYSFCFVVTGETCATHALRPIDLGVPLTYTHANVLLVPPTAIDPLGPQMTPDHLDAALRGIRAWQPAFEAFATDHPTYAHLRELTVHVDVFDGAPTRAGYDVLVVWAPYTGPIFRGAASSFFGGGALCLDTGTCALRETLEPWVHDGGRVIIMSAFAAAPRAGQVVPDLPETSDVYNVMLHEFAHTWGLGHTQTWTAGYGPDLMNSPYALVFGDGDPLGDGGERTPEQCISSLDLYGMARLYEWVGRGVPWDERLRASSTGLPGSVPYRVYCPA